MVTSKDRLVTYVPTALKADLEVLAAQEGRSISNLLEQIVREKIGQAKANGRL
jgi:hypothetical protein